MKYKVQSNSNILNQGMRSEKNKNMIKKIAGAAFLLLLGSLTQSCSKAGGNSTGHEYMPDMVHSIAYEANIYDYYSYNRWGGDSAYYAMAKPRLPQKHTIPISYIVEGKSSEEALKQMQMMKGIAPITLSETVTGYKYTDSEEQRVLAEKELCNPFPIKNDALKNIAEVYNIYCGICHGEKGDGTGFLARDGSPYPAAPADFTKDEFVNAGDGRFYHAIMWGKNVMGSYADKLSETERWEVIHYIRSLQAKAKNLKYDETENTLNNNRFLCTNK